MDLLVTETEIRERMSLPEHADISDAVLSALGAAQIRIESALGVKFTRQTGLRDIFRINVKEKWFSLPDDLAILRLKAGFIDKDSVVIRSYDTLEYAMDPAVTGDVVDARYYSVTDDDAMKGVVRINALQYDLHFIEVSYDAGFTDADDEHIPDWLTEAIISRASGVLTTVSPNDQTAEALSLLAEQQSQIAQIISPYARGSIPFSFRPVL